MIYLLIAVDLLLPKVSSRTGQFEQMTRMAVPEATVDEYHGAMLGKYKVRSSRKTIVVQNITKAPCMKASPDSQFWLRILAPDAGHHPAAYLGRYDINHRQTLDRVPSRRAIPIAASPSGVTDFRSQSECEASSTERLPRRQALPQRSRIACTLGCLKQGCDTPTRPRDGSP